MVFDDLNWRMLVEELIFRAAERIIAVVIGGFSIYLGYLLFIKIPEQKDSSGKIILPGGVSIFLSRIGPGVFFSLFGSLIVAFSFYSVMVIDAPVMSSGEGNAPSKTEASVNVRYLSDDSSTVSKEMLVSMRSEAQRTMFEMNRLPTIFPADLSPTKRIDVNQAIRESKLAIIKSVWGDDWGSYAQFKNWIVKGASDPMPKELNTDAVKLFNNGQ